MKSLTIKNTNHYKPPVKLINLIDIDINKLSVNHVGTDELGIFYVEYNDAPLYLVCDNVIGFIEESEENKCLTFSLMKNNKLYNNIWNKLKELCNGNKDEFDKDINVVMFESDDKINGKCMIDTMTIVIKSVFKDGANYFPKIALNYCFYSKL